MKFPKPVPYARRLVIRLILAGTCILFTGGVVDAVALQEFNQPQTTFYADLKTIIYIGIALASGIGYVVYNRTTVNALRGDLTSLQKQVSAHTQNSAIHQESLSRELVDSKLENIHQRIDHVVERVDVAEKSLSEKLDDLKGHITRTINGSGH